MNKNRTDAPVRGRLLTIYLAIMIATSVINLIFSLSGKNREFPFHANYPDWMFSYLTAAGLFSLTFNFAIWKMKRWGVWGSIVLILISSVLVLYFRHGSEVIVSMAISILILALVIWKPYQRMT